MFHPPFRLGLIFALLAPLPSSANEKPPGFEQILPRGRIAAIDAPTYVSAREANIPGSAWVLGFAIGNRAYAYSLNLLNAHEVVNDDAEGQPFAAVW